MPHPYVLNGLRVDGDHLGTKPAQLHSNIERRGIAHVARTRLAAQPENGHLRRVHAIAERFDRTIYDPRATSKVDRVDFLETRDRFTAIELLCSSGERADVFR